MSTNPGQPAISVADLQVTRGGKKVLKGVSFTVERGTITGLLGPSGCGKTTLMRAIVGTQIISSGTVTVLGDPAGAPILRRQIGYMTQAASVYHDLSIQENVRYFAALFGKSAADADAAIQTVGLTDHSQHRGDELSGGQQARVSLACALVADPALLVLDEPTVGLDPVLRAELWHEFRELARQGRTLLVSSHVMDEADHCDQLLLMREGQLVEQLSPDELRSRTGESNLERAFLVLIQSQGQPA